MTSKNELSNERAAFLFELLVDEGVVEDNQIDPNEKYDQVSDAVEDLVRKSADFYTGRKRSQTTLNLGKASFLREYLEGASLEELVHVLEDLGWSSGHQRDFDKLAVSSLKSYPRLLREIKKAEEHPEELNDIENEESRDLDDAIFEMIDDGSLPNGYGGQLRLFLGKVRVPVGTSNNVVAALKAQASGQLRVDLQRYKKSQKGNSEGPVIPGIEYLERLTAGVSIDSLAEDMKPKHGNDETFAKIRIGVESRIAKALEQLYRSKD